MKNNLLLLALFCFCQTIFSQNEASNWFFGETAGINFNPSGTVSILDNGQLNTIEGCSSISDQNGNLLLYTDGRTVYNRNHNVMENGLFLLGDESSTQSAIVIPKPENPNIYYIFTVGSNQNPTGLNYSVVDISLADGLGEVTQKNINLLTHCSEKVSAVLNNCQSGEIWVVTLVNQLNIDSYSSVFKAFKVSNTGVNHAPVSSQFELSISDARGYLKFSPNGTKIACANGGSGLYLLDFDKQTGIVSNPQNLSVSNPTADVPYGVEFSPNNNLLYVTCSNDIFDSSGSSNNNIDVHKSVLFQYNLSAENISNSRVTLDERTLFRGGLQLGPDGKIYRALSATYTQGSFYLGVINNPNVLGVGSNYQHNAVYLGNKKSTQGLPPFIQSYFNQKIDIIRNGNSDSVYLTLCIGESYTLSVDPIADSTYIWYFNGNIIDENDNDLIVTQSGHYELYIFLDSDNCTTLEGEAYVEYFDYPVANNSTLYQCDEDGIPDGLTIFNLNQIINNITDSASDVNVKFFSTLSDAQINNSNGINSIYQNTSNPQIIYANVTNIQSGCSSIAEITLEVSVTQLNDYISNPVCDVLGPEDGISTFDLNLIATEMLLGIPEGVNIRFYENYENALLEQNELQSPYTNTTPYTQTIFARAENNNACYGISQVELTVLELPNIDIEDETIYCLNFFPETITITAGVVDDSPSNYYYFWSTGENTSEIMVNAPGTYTVRVTNTNGCYKDRIVTVLPSNIATITDINVVDASQNNSITIIVSGEGDYEYAIDNINGPYQDSNTFQNISAGLHTRFCAG